MWVAHFGGQRPENYITGRARLIRTDSSAMFSFEIGGIRINSAF